MKKLLAFMTAAIVFALSTCSTYAASNQSMQVSYSVSADYLISLPMSCEFSGDSQGTYQAGAYGTICGDDIVYIIPQDQDPNTEGIQVVLNDTASTNPKPDIAVTVTQEKTSFTSAEVGAMTDGVITGTLTNGSLVAPNNVPAGRYSGTLEFLSYCSNNADTYIEKVTLMNSLSFYGAGDSIMEGYGNDYKGVLSYLENMYGGTIEKDYSVSGSRVNADDINSIQSVADQTATMLARMGYRTPTSKTVLIWDGGGNDFMNAISAANSSGADPTAAGLDSMENDIAPSLGGIYAALSNVYINENNVSDFVCVYIIPSLKNAVGTDYNNYFASALTSLFGNASDHVIIIDCNEFIEDSDITNDGLHLNHSGYTKLSNAIADKLYNWYSN